MSPVEAGNGGLRETTEFDFHGQCANSSDMVNGNANYGTRILSHRLSALGFRTQKLVE